MIWAFLGFTISVAGIPQGDTWASVWFQDVALSRGAPKVTVQVAWLRPPRVSTDSEMPTVVSIFQGERGHRKLMASTRVAKIGDPGFGATIELHTIRKTGEAMLFLPLMESGKLCSGLYRFDGYRPKLLLDQRSLDTGDLKNGVVTQWDSARYAKVKVPKWEHPNPPVERKWVYDFRTREFVAKPWRIVQWQPEVGEIRGANGGHSFHIRLQQRNFRLGRRKVVFRRDGVFTIDGQMPYGTDFPAEDEQKKREGQRGLFTTELISFTAEIDGKPIEVPKRLWQNCFEPNLSTKRDPRAALEAWLSKDGQRLVVKMLGSDAAGSYSVEWTIRSDGRVTREVTAGLC